MNLKTAAPTRKRGNVIELLGLQYGFFAPKAGYAATGKLGMQVDEFKALVKDLHKNGIEVILMSSLTTQLKETRTPHDFSGIDNKTYYMLSPDGYYYNFSGAATPLTATIQLCATSYLIVCATGRISH